MFLARLRSRLCTASRDLLGLSVQQGLRIAMSVLASFSRVPGNDEPVFLDSLRALLAQEVPSPAGNRRVDRADALMPMRVLDAVGRRPQISKRNAEGARLRVEIDRMPIPESEFDAYLD